MSPSSVLFQLSFFFFLLFPLEGFLLAPLSHSGIHVRMNMQITQAGITRLIATWVSDCYSNSRALI